MYERISDENLLCTCDHCSTPFLGIDAIAETYTDNIHLHGPRKSMWRSFVEVFLRRGLYRTNRLRDFGILSYSADPGLRGWNWHTLSSAVRWNGLFASSQKF